MNQGTLLSLFLLFTAYSDSFCSVHERLDHGLDKKNDIGSRHKKHAEQKDTSFPSNTDDVEYTTSALFMPDFNIVEATLHRVPRPSKKTTISGDRPHQHELRRVKRVTNKFTGLVVGASGDVKLKESVMAKLKDIESSIWGMQSQKTTTFQDQNPATILGSFLSHVRTNFRGAEPLVKARHDAKRSLPDVNSYATLLVLTLVTESQLYGGMQIASASKFNLAVQALEQFQSRQYFRESTILTLWPEKAMPNVHGWVNYPENLVLTKVMDGTTYGQLASLVKSCSCEHAKSGLGEINDNSLCKEYFNTPFSEIVYDQATPPDFLTSFTNFALGCLLQARHSDTKLQQTGVFQTELKLWQTSNSNILELLDKLKIMSVTMPTASKHVTTNGSGGKLNVSTSGKSDQAQRTTMKNATHLPAPLMTTHTNTTAVTGNDDRSNAKKIPEVTNGTVLTPSSAETLGPKLNNDSRKDSGSQTKSVQMRQISGTPAINKTSEANESKVKISKITDKNITGQTSNSSSPPVPAVAPPLVSLLDNARIEHVIDSTSYYALHLFFDQQMKAGNDVVLIPTWMSDDLEGDVRYNNQLFHSYNTVDLTTTATVLHALVVSHMSGVANIESDDDLKKITTSSLRLLTWYASHPKELQAFLNGSRFPSRSQLFWLMSRIAFQLNSTQATSGNLFHFVGNAVSDFLNSLRKDMTMSILQSIVDGGLGSDGKTRVFIDEFLGVSDLDNTKKKKITGDDRLFASAMAINTLIFAWTVQQTDGTLQFIESTDDSVRIAINSLVNYVSSVVGDSSTLLDNAFMTDQVKNCKTFSAQYPANVVTSRDGKPASPTSQSYKLRYGVKGYFPADAYQKELQSPRFVDLQSSNRSDELNCPTSLFRYWSCPAYTKAACLMAIALAANLKVNKR
ncbi:hypothetical protein Btru_042546 [Bulinus truncatus]|nr:hypothetical protein Btru_042546 [Bulinus truncatus]